MSRPLRISYKNAFYHITSRGHRKEKIFYDDIDKRKFIQKLDETFQKYKNNWGQVSTFDITHYRC